MTRYFLFTPLEKGVTDTDFESRSKEHDRLVSLPGAVYVPGIGVFVPEESYDTFHVASVSRQDFATIGRDASALTDEQVNYPRLKAGACEVLRD